MILATMPKGTSGGGGLSREEAVDVLAADLLAKVPPAFEAEPTRERLRKLGPTQPLTIHLRQEVALLNRVLALATSTLANLRLAIAGTIALNEELAEALDALAAARVPCRLAKVSWPAAGLGGWFAGLLTRHDQLWRWLTTGRPRSFLLSGFFNPGVGSGGALGSPWKKLLLLAASPGCCCHLLGSCQTAITVGPASRAS